MDLPSLRWVKSDQVSAIVSGDDEGKALLWSVLLAVRFNVDDEQGVQVYEMGRVDVTIAEEEAQYGLFCSSQRPLCRVWRFCSG